MSVHPQQSSKQAQFSVQGQRVNLMYNTPSLQRTLFNPQQRRVNLQQQAPVPIVRQCQWRVNLQYQGGSYNTCKPSTVAPPTTNPGRPADPTAFVPDPTIGGSGYGREGTVDPGELSFPAGGNAEISQSDYYNPDPHKDPFSDPYGGSDPYSSIDPYGGMNPGGGDPYMDPSYMQFMGQLDPLTGPSDPYLDPSTGLMNQMDPFGIPQLYYGPMDPLHSGTWGGEPSELGRFYSPGLTSTPTTQMPPGPSKDPQPARLSNPDPVVPPVKIDPITGLPFPPGGIYTPMSPYGTPQTIQLTPLLTTLLTTLLTQPPIQIQPVPGPTPPGTPPPPVQIQPVPGPIPTPPVQIQPVPKPPIIPRDPNPPTISPPIPDPEPPVIIDPPAEKPPKPPTTPIVPEIPSDPVGESGTITNTTPIYNTDPMRNGPVKNTTSTSIFRTPDHHRWYGSTSSGVQWTKGGLDDDIGANRSDAFGIARMMKLSYDPTMSHPLTQRVA